MQDPPPAAAVWKALSEEDAEITAPGAVITTQGDLDKPNAPAFMGHARGARVCQGTAGSPAQGRSLHGAKGFPRPSCAFGFVQAG